MTGKSEALYTRVFDALCQNDQFEPTYIVSDFEQAAINATQVCTSLRTSHFVSQVSHFPFLFFQNRFPNANSHGCFFHLAQSVWRKVQDYGLKERYLTDDNFREAIKMVPALAFIPPNDVVESFELLQTTFENDDDVQRKSFACKSNKLDTKFCSLFAGVLDYFEEVYVGRLRRHRRGNPLFPIRVWNCYDATADHLPRTNNNVEGWHRAFQVR